MRIRAEKPQDIDPIRAITEAAFETSAEADLIDALRVQANPLVSLVAEDADAVIGHILFSPVTLSGASNLKLMGLAPMAVLPDHQRSGIGSQLVRAGLDACEEIGIGAVVVLGHPDYYPRFGFILSTRFGIHSEYDVPEEVFMALELQAGYLDGLSGKIRYHSAFNTL